MGYNDYIMQMLMNMMSDRDKQPLSELSSYDYAMNRAWENINPENLENLETLKGKNLRLKDHIMKGKNAEQTIPIEDSYNLMNDKIDNQIELVRGYENFTSAHTDDEGNEHLGTIPTLFGDVEGVLANTQKVLDQLNTKVFGEGYDSWESLLASGTEEHKAMFNKEVAPYMDQASQDISSILLRITDAENQFSKYTKFSDAGFTGRDIELLRQMSTGLLDELGTTTFLTDEESVALQEMWKTKNTRPYVTLKAEQKQRSDVQSGMLKSELNALAKQEAKYQSIYNDMLERDVTENRDEDMTRDQIQGYIAQIQADREKKEIQMLKIGEYGQSAGLGSNFDLVPLSPKAIKLKEEGKLGLPVEKPEEPEEPEVAVDPMRAEYDKWVESKIEAEPQGDMDFITSYEDFPDFETWKSQKEKDKEIIPKKDKEIVPKEEAVDLDAMIDEYIGMFKGTGFGRTSEGKAFADKHGLNVNGNIMKELQVIGNTKLADPNNELGGTQPRIDKGKEKITGWFEDVEAKNLDKQTRKSKDFMKAYAKNNKIPKGKIEIIKEAYPKIDEYIAEWKEYGSGQQFLVWLRKRIDQGKADEIDYSKFKGIL